MKRNNNIVSYRTCLYTNNEFKKSELIRFVKYENKLVVDLKQNMPGRGYWLKLTDQAINDPKLIQILSKRTRCNVSQDLIEELKKLWKM